MAFDTVAGCATAAVTGDFDLVNALERAVGEATRAAGRQLYVMAYVVLQNACLVRRPERFTQAVRVFTGPAPNEFHRLMRHAWDADKGAALSRLNKRSSR